MKQWFEKQWNDVKGNAKWALLVALWWLVIHAGSKMLYLIPNIQPWLVWSILLAASFFLFLWLAKSPRAAAAIQPLTPQQATGMPTLSSLNAQVPDLSKVNLTEIFRTSYYSPVTAEFEHNIQIVAHQFDAKNPEAFYARFIGVGLVAYLHDMTWSLIFKSQLLMLGEMNHRNGFLSLIDAKSFYDAAVVEYPRVYENYSFDQWIAFMASEQLILRYPSNMLEITHRGKDFIKYLAHWGRKADQRAG